MARASAEESISQNSKMEFFSFVAKNSEGNSRQHFKELVRNSYSFILKFLSFLPPIDQDIARLYYVDGLSQDQIRRLYQISQAAVSRRLKFVFIRIQFLLKMPSLNPVQVREDLRFLFGDNLFEFAYFFYWELAQNRVKFFIDTSQSGAANKLLRVIQYLERITEAPECDKNLIDLNYEKKKYLAFVYLDYFRFIRRKSNVVTFVYKKNDRERSGCVIKGNEVLSDI